MEREGETPSVQRHGHVGPDCGQLTTLGADSAAAHKRSGSHAPAVASLGTQRSAPCLAPSTALGFPCLPCTALSLSALCMTLRLVKTVNKVADSCSAQRCQGEGERGVERRGRRRRLMALTGGFDLSTLRLTLGLDVPVLVEP